MARLGLVLCVELEILASTVQAGLPATRYGTALTGADLEARDLSNRATVACPDPTTLTCESDECKGGGGGDDAKCTAGRSNGCGCVSEGTMYTYPLPAQWPELEELLRDFVYVRPDPSTIPHPACASEGTLTMERALFQKLTAKWCEETSLEDDRSQSLESTDVGAGATFRGYRFDFEFRGLCSDFTCADIYDLFGSSCAYGSHTLHTRGSIVMRCGTARYSISAPATRAA
ncbi:hypothetical protein F4780DRAFT_778658 [Xylariomycetidae sp. FL0641]|nr:hypothetical protein F4780DRAFT_778658 [Xylariomycetidae sp. FL0641]